MKLALEAETVVAVVALVDPGAIPALPATRRGFGGAAGAASLCSL